MAFTAEMLAQIEAQRAYFASADHVRERAEPWRGETPERRWAATIERCREAEYLMTFKTPAEQQLASRGQPIPADVLAILERLQHVR